MRGAKSNSLSEVLFATVTSDALPYALIGRYLNSARLHLGQEKRDQDFQCLKAIRNQGPLL